MFDNVQNASIAVSSEEDLLAAMGTPKTTDKAPKEKTGKDKTDATDETKDKPTKSTKDKPATSSKKTVTELSKADLEIAAGAQDDDDDNDVDDTETDKDDENDSNDKVDSDDDDQNDKDDDKTDKDDKDETTGEISVNDFLKARVNLLVKKGEWLDFEGRDEVEWDEETFAEVELKQRAAQKEQLREDLLDEFGPYGRAIAEYSANGGDAEDLIDIFKEQQRVENLSIDTEESQREVVFKYVTEFQRMKPERAKKYIDGLVADKGLEDAAKEAKDEMETELKAQEKALKDNQAEEQKLAKQKIKQSQEKFSTDVNNILKLRDDIPADEKRDLLKVLTKFDKTINNGTTVNDFYFKFAEFRKDLPSYIEMVRLVLNPKKYLKTVKNTGKTETTEKDFSLLRTGNKTKKVKTSSTPNDRGEKKSTFKLIY
jgi:hypothetical protein